MRKKPKTIVILGPTASGKSELAVKLAKKYNGEVVSADSRQIYKGLDIGTGKVPRDRPKTNPDKSGQKPKIQNNGGYYYKGIRHHLIDVAGPKKTFTVVQYQKLAKKAIKDIIKRGKLPIICGGTGFYIDALIYDYQLPKAPPNKKLRKELEKKSAEELFGQLKKLDPRRANAIDRRNKRRLIRAIEIVLATGRPVPPSFAKDSGNYQVLKIGIKKSPAELKKLIRKRLGKRLRQGLIKEVKSLHYKTGLGWQRLDNLGLEYRYVSRYLRGLLTKKEMVEILQKEICRYAKRQMTWFKKESGAHWVANPASADSLVKNSTGAD